MGEKMVRAADLVLGQEVVADGDPLGFTVHAVTQSQGKVQVPWTSLAPFTPDPQ